MIEITCKRIGIQHEVLGRYVTLPGIKHSQVRGLFVSYYLYFLEVRTCPKKQQRTISNHQYSKIMDMYVELQTLTIQLL